MARSRRTVRTLSEEAIEEIRQLIQDFYGPGDPPIYYGAPNFEDESTLAPELYLALTLGHGIPALDPRIIQTGTGTGSGIMDLPDRPGKGECNIYRIIENNDGVAELYLMDGLTHTVYNKEQCSIPGGSYIFVARDKLGFWWALDGWLCIADTGTGTGTTGCHDCDDFVEDVRCVGNVIVEDKFSICWTLDGRRLKRSEAPCSGAKPPPVQSPCGLCSADTDPGNTIHLNVSGSSNDGCNDCSNVNGDWTLQKAAPCFWDGEDFALCTNIGSTTGRWAAYLAITGESNLTWIAELRTQPGNALILRYEVIANANCTLPYTMNRTSFAAGTCNYPSTANLH